MVASLKMLSFSFYRKGYTLFVLMFYAVETAVFSYLPVHATGPFYELFEKHAGLRKKSY